MNGAEQILVIILGVFLAIFLVLGITLITIVIKLLKKVKHIVETAEKMADSAERVGAIVRDASGPLALFKVIHNITKTVKNRSDR